METTKLISLNIIDKCINFDEFSNMFNIMYPGEFYFLASQSQTNDFSSIKESISKISFESKKLKYVIIPNLYYRKIFAFITITRDSTKISPKIMQFRQSCSPLLRFIVAQFHDDYNLLVSSIYKKLHFKSNLSANNFQSIPLLISTKPDLWDYNYFINSYPGEYVNALYYSLSQNNFSVLEKSSTSPFYFSAVFQDKKIDLNRNIVQYIPQNYMFCSFYFSIDPTISWLLNTIKSFQISSSMYVPRAVTHPSTNYLYNGTKFYEMLNHSIIREDFPKSFFKWTDWTLAHYETNVTDTLIDSLQPSSEFLFMKDLEIGMLWLFIYYPISKQIGCRYKRNFLPKCGLDILDPTVISLHSKEVQAKDITQNDTGKIKEDFINEKKLVLPESPKTNVQDEGNESQNYQQKEGNENYSSGYKNRPIHSKLFFKKEENPNIYRIDSNSKECQPDVIRSYYFNNGNLYFNYHDSGFFSLHSDLFDISNLDNYFMFLHQNQISFSYEVGLGSFFHFEEFALQFNDSRAIIKVTGENPIIITRDGNFISSNYIVTSDGILSIKSIINKKETWIRIFPDGHSIPSSPFKMIKNSKGETKMIRKEKVDYTFQSDNSRKIIVNSSITIVQKENKISFMISNLPEIILNKTNQEFYFRLYLAEESSSLITGIAIDMECRLTNDGASLNMENFKMSIKNDNISINLEDALIFLKPHYCDIKYENQMLHCDHDEIKFGSSFLTAQQKIEVKNNWINQKLLVQQRVLDDKEAIKKKKEEREKWLYETFGNLPEELLDPDDMNENLFNDPKYLLNEIFVTRILEQTEDENIAQATHWGKMISRTDDYSENELKLLYQIYRPRFFAIRPDLSSVEYLRPDAINVNKFELVYNHVMHPSGELVNIVTYHPLDSDVILFVDWSSLDTKQTKIDEEKSNVTQSLFHSDESYFLKALNSALIQAQNEHITGIELLDPEEFQDQLFFPPRCISPRFQKMQFFKYLVEPNIQKNSNFWANKVEHFHCPESPGTILDFGEIKKDTEAKMIFQLPKNILAEQKCKQKKNNRIFKRNGNGTNFNSLQKMRPEPNMNLFTIKSNMLLQAHLEMTTNNTPKMSQEFKDLIKKSHEKDSNIIIRAPDSNIHAEVSEKGEVTITIRPHKVGDFTSTFWIEGYKFRLEIGIKAIVIQ